MGIRIQDKLCAFGDVVFNKIGGTFKMPNPKFFTPRKNYLIKYVEEKI